MDSRYYEILRQATQEDFFSAINDPEDEMYDIVWDLFETVVIEPAEIFDKEFREQNQFRYSINSGVTLEFFPEASYFERRIEPNPFKDDSDPAGIHLKFALMPEMSCLFSASFQVWGAAERTALKKLWRQHRKLLSDLFRRVKPMVFTLVPQPGIELAANLEELLDNYFAVRDSENFIAFQYSFAQTDEAELAQNFMVTMALVYQSIKDLCLNKVDHLGYWFAFMRDFYSGHLPELPAPLPCVELVISSDAG